MSNVDKITGPQNPLQPSGAREKRLPDEAAFKKTLEKVGETDPEQKKKKKQQQEESEEVKKAIEEAHHLPKPTDTIAPFQTKKALSAQPSLEKGSPFSIEKGALPTPNITEGADVEPLYPEEEIAPAPFPSEVEEEGVAAKKEATIGELKLKEKKVEPKKLEEALLIEKEAILAEKKKAEKKEAPPPIEGLNIALEATGGPIAPPAPTEIQPYAQMPMQVLELFERMVGVITVMDKSGIKETTISLSGPQFKNSTFYGAEIVIKEYSTAPKEYNIELRGTPEATALFHANIPYLENSFRMGNYNFRINRLETSLSKIPEEPVKERDEEEKRDK